MTTKEKDTLDKAIAAAGVPVLPDICADEQSQTWMKAIVHVTKSDGTSNYALAINKKGDGRPVITHDFGNVAVVKRVNGIYPYLVLDSASVPLFKSKNEIMEYLTGRGCPQDRVVMLLANRKGDGTAKTEEEKAKDRAKVKSWIYKIAVVEQLRNLS